MTMKNISCKEIFYLDFGFISEMAGELTLHSFLQQLTLLQLLTF